MFPGFTIMGKFIGSYALCILAGIFTACPLSIHWYKRRGGDDTSIILMYLWAALGIFIGMHLLYGITNIGYWGLLLNAADFIDFVKRFVFLFGGSVFYGGLFGGLIAGAVSIRVQKMPVALTADCAAPAIALFHCFGRIGCFLGGCCYGIESESGIVFTNALIESANGVPRVPVQLFEAGFELMLFLLLWYLLGRGKLSGGLLSLYLMLYAVGRFFLEFLRGDEYRGIFFGLSTSQWISIVVFVVVGIFGLLKVRKRAADV